MEIVLLLNVSKYENCSKSYILFHFQRHFRKLDVEHNRIMLSKLANDEKWAGNFPASCKL